MENSSLDCIPTTINSINSKKIRPIFSVMIPTYNCANFLIKTIESVLSQDLGEDYMEIEVIDDCSTIDNPENIVKQYGRGRVKYFKKERNEGATLNFNTCIERSNGLLIHILHGDDYVLPLFYEKIYNEFLKNSEIDACITRSKIVSEKDSFLYFSPSLEDLYENQLNYNTLFYNNPIRTPSVVIKRQFYEKHGGFVPSLVHTADWELWIRVILKSKVVFINEPLVSYRFFDGNDTGRLASNGENLNDYLRLANILRINYMNFNYSRFYYNVTKMALSQAEMFKVLGRIDSYKSNYNLYRKLKNNLPFSLRIKENLKIYTSLIKFVIRK